MIKKIGLAITIIFTSTLIGIQFNSSLPIALAATPCSYTVTVDDDTSQKTKDLENQIKIEIKEVFDAINSRLKYLGTCNFSKINVLSEKEMEEIYKKRGGKAGYILDGHYDPNTDAILLNESLFLTKDINDSHVVIGHEMLHGYSVCPETDLKNLVEEGMDEYLSTKYLHGPKDSYNGEVGVIKEMLNAFSRLGDPNPDDTLQKILFQECPAGIDQRLNKYLPKGKPSAYGYLNSLLNDGRYDQAGDWLKSIKKEEPAVPSIKPMNLKPKQEEKSVILNWDKIGEANFYKVYINGSMPSDGKITDTSQTSYTHKNVGENTSYNYAVRAYKAGVNEPIGKGDASLTTSEAATAAPTPEAPTTSTPSEGQPIPIGAPFPGEKPKVTLMEHITAAHRWASIIGTLIAILMIIFAGFKYTTSVGNPEALQDAKDQMIGALIGLAIILLTYILLQVVGVKVERAP